MLRHQKGVKKTFGSDQGHLSKFEKKSKVSNGLIFK